MIACVKQYARPEIQQLQPYHVEEAAMAVKLDANELGYDVPAEIKQQMLQGLAYLPFNRYPDPSGKELTWLIAHAYGVEPQQVLLGCGSSELLLAVCSVFGGNGKAIVFPWPSFSMYKIYSQFVGSHALPIPLGQQYGLDIEGLIAAARQAGLVLISNPNNPTGTLYSLKDIETVVSRVECPVVIDEAYGEFGGQSALELLEKHDNLIITRTFSKAYGLAGSRLGYLFAHRDMAQTIGKALMPYHVNALTLLVGETAFRNRALYRPLWDELLSERAKMAAALRQIPGVQVYDSATNFIWFHTNHADAMIGRELAKQSIAVRDFSTAPAMEGCVRVNIGTPTENERFITALTQLLKEA